MVFIMVGLLVALLEAVLVIKSNSDLSNEEFNSHINPRKGYRQVVVASFVALYIAIAS
ncbi:hypothetical protein [Adhaeribacter aquaticus]|uniref:hypothetical protein n=1 Tax=Adhaeribacter aquaticus TaxID=299567 RepID=UPI0012F94427|nr:hypothetical protein [Adhaeribacter aquaticus]